ncbi:MAG TPA: transcription elongation factor GreA [Pirellulaceae bacterium]|nr:transcription elongation factor GreA [Pirellulaceae bacterium]
MSDYIPMTASGYAKIRAEIERLENEEMPIVREALANARSEGDLRENAEYHGQRETLGMLTAKVNALKSKLSRATIVDETKLPRDEVAFGATVRVLDVDLDDEETFTLVGAGDEDYDQGKYLVTSPIGQGLLGKRVGDRAEIAVPKGKIVFEILEITYPD